MNNIERFKSGDKRLQVVVKDMSDKQKILVQKGFFSLHWWWNGNPLCGFMFLNEEIYSNTLRGNSIENINSLLRNSSRYNKDGNYPTTSFTELMILANMESLPEVVPFLDENELKKYNIKQEGNMKSNEFTKDMLKDGMFVLLRNQDNEFSKGYHVVLKEGFIDQGGFLPKDDYTDNLIFEKDADFDVVEVLTSEKVTSLDENSLEEELTSIWKRPFPEEEQRLSEKAALQEDIEAVKERLKSMESKLESM